jgi:hypothetical protein
MKTLYVANRSPTGNRLLAYPLNEDEVWGAGVWLRRARASMA